MSREIHSNGVPHYQISFFCSGNFSGSGIPPEVVNVQSTTTPEQLNNLVNELAKQTNDSWEEFQFDFLINGILLRTSLEEFVDAYQFITEKVIQIECITKEPPPIPSKNFIASDWVSDVKFIRADRLISVNYSGELVLWENLKNVKNGTTSNNDSSLAIKFGDGPLKCLDYVEISDEKLILVGSQDQTITLVNYVPGTKNKPGFRAKALLRGHQRSVECVAFGAGGTRALSGSFDKYLKVWRTDPNDENRDENFIPHVNSQPKKKSKSEVITKTPMVTLESHRDAIVDVKWNPLNEKQAYTVSWDHTIILWDLELSGPVQNLNSNKAFTSISINNLSGMVLTGSTDPIIRLWDFRSQEGSLVKDSYFGHKGWVSDVHWCPDTENLFVSSSFDNTVKMWDIRSPKASLFDLMGHKDRVLCVDWSEPRQIASGSIDCTVKTFSRKK